MRRRAIELHLGGVRRGAALLIASAVIACTPRDVEPSDGDEIAGACRRLAACGGVFAGDARMCARYYEHSPVDSDDAAEIECVREGADCDEILACRGEAQALRECADGARCDGTRVVVCSSGTERSHDCARLGFVCVDSGWAPSCSPSCGDLECVDAAKQPTGHAWIRTAVGGAPRVSIDASRLADPQLLHDLALGRAQRLAAHVYAYDDTGEPMPVANRVCRVWYDAWMRGYQVEIESPKRRKPAILATMEDVLDACLYLRGFALPADNPRVRSPGVRFAALVEVDPPAPEALNRVRAWLRHPDAADGEDAFFGSFVGVLVNERMGGSERSVRRSR